MEFFSGFLVWITFSIAIGYWATSNEKEGWRWGLLSLFFSPLLAATFLYFAIESDRKTSVELARKTLEVRSAEARQEAAEKEAKKEQEKRDAAEKEALIQQSTIGAADFVIQIEKNFTLFENNLFDADEFAEKKRFVISSLWTKRPRESAEDFLSALIPLIKRKALTQEDIVSIKKAVL